MKKAGILAKRYAKALFLIGKERNILDDVSRDLSVYAKALTENQDFCYFFDSPEVSRKEKEKKIEELFGKSFTEIFQNFLLIILKKGRQNLLLEVADAFNDELDIHHNRVKANVTSSIELTPEMQKEIQKQLEKQLEKEVILISDVDATLMGGLRITIEGKVIDGSVRGQLHRMRQYLMRQTTQALN